MNSNLENIEEDINGLNGKMEYYIPQIESDSIFTFEEEVTWVFRLEKRGKIVFMTTNISGKMKTVRDTPTLLTLPEEYWPIANIYNSYTTQRGTPMLICILVNGEMQLHNNNTDITESQFILRQCLSWFTK